MAQHFKVHDTLPPAELAELEEYARDLRKTIDDCHQWLLTRGYTMSRSAVWNWLREFRKRVMAERFNRAGELAGAIKGAVEAGKFESIADAAVMQLTQVIFEQASKLDENGPIKPGDLLNMTLALKTIVGGKAQLAKMLAEKFDREAAKLVTQRRQITADDIERVRKAVFG